MTLKAYIGGIGLASVVASVSFLAILWFSSPEGASPAVLILFFLSLFLSLCGLFGLAGFYFRRRRAKEESLLAHFLSVSFREGALLSLLISGFLLMKMFNTFYWWTALIFLIITVAIEITFLYQEKE